MIIAVDFDATCVTHEYPNIGEDIGAVPVLKALTDNGHKLILWTMRDYQTSHGVLPQGVVESGKDCLSEAVKWFEDRDIPLWGINKNPEQDWTNSPKVYAHIYIDDAAFGIPLRYNQTIHPRPFVDWTVLGSRMYSYGYIDYDQIVECFKYWRKLRMYPELSALTMDEAINKVLYGTK